MAELASQEGWVVSVVEEEPAVQAAEGGTELPDNMWVYLNYMYSSQNGSR
jgi:hypothetical protein